MPEIITAETRLETIPHMQWSAQVFRTMDALQAFLNSELSDVNPILVKTALSYGSANNPDSFWGYVFYCKVSLPALPTITLPNRWVVVQRKTSEDVVQLLNNLVPNEALYAQIGQGYSLDPDSITPRASAAKNNFLVSYPEEAK